MPNYSNLSLFVLPLVGGFGAPANGGGSRLAWGSWMRGIIAGFIGGGAGAFSGGVGALISAPDQFNFGHPRVLLQTMGGMFLITGLMHTMAYLAQKPIPDVVMTTTTETVTTPQIRHNGDPIVTKTEIVQKVEKV